MLAVIFMLVCIFLDQLTKYIVLGQLKGRPPVIIIDNFLSFAYVENRGAAFGILQGRKIFFIIITLISVAIISYILIFNYKKLPKTIIISLGAILGGTIGNFIDRIRLGYVVDFVSMRFFDKYDFAVFNLADAFIVLGAFFLMIYIIFFEGKKNGL
ncbi:MAG: signal peptidase II [Bacillota bacterium]|nr:signal peptidase II [Bacillota bacterium]